MKIMLNSKELAENDNETHALKNNISDIIEKELQEINERMEESVTRMKEEMAALKENTKEMTHKNEESCKDFVLKLNESKNRMNEEVTHLKAENEELQKLNKKMDEKITSLENKLLTISKTVVLGWKVCACLSV